MQQRGARARKQFKRVNRLFRELRMIAGGLLDTDHVILAHLIVTRRCNLACSYCNEYDQSSPPIPLGTLEARVDALARLGTQVITLSGGEPLLNPWLAQVVKHVRRRGMIAGLITNGYLLTREKIEAFNQAGLDHLQISIDNVRPGPSSVKSLKVLDRKLQLLAEFAEFHVNVNTVLGAQDSNPEDAVAIARRARELGFSSTVGIVHDAWGQVRPLGPRERAAFEEIQRIGKSSYARVSSFRENLAAGRPNEWRCRAGARYLYVCEDGLVHYCSQQRGYPGKPVEAYTLDDIRREFRAQKSCAPKCTISCVHQVSQIDAWRAPQQPSAPAGLAPEPLVQIGSASD
jgi:MoaA/NifB/PqqE/SkfB family radical SAM enzyme